MAGQHVVGFLKATTESSGDDHATSYSREVAAICLTLLGQDSDGSIIIDYLGAGFKKHIAGKIENAVYTDARKFIDDQITQWQAKQCGKLLARYERLRHYFEVNSVC